MGLIQGTKAVPKHEASAVLPARVSLSLTVATPLAAHCPFRPCALPVSSSAGGQCARADGCAFLGGRMVRVLGFKSTYGCKLMRPPLKKTMG